MGRLVFSPASRRDLRKILPACAERVLDALEALVTAANPLAAANARKLRGRGGFHRLRTGDFRAVFRLQGNFVRVVRVFDRKDMERILASLWN